MHAPDQMSLEPVRAVVKREGVIDFKDEGETPEGAPLGQLRLRSSDTPVYPDGRWVSLEEARKIAHYFGVELVES
jgi:hypothetical protein